MMVPNVFKDDIGECRKWKEEVSKYFDESQEGMKVILDIVSKEKSTITKEVLEQSRRSYLGGTERLLKWKT